MAFLRRCLQLVHWGPLLALSIIFYISLTTLHCNSMYWPTYTSGGIINMVIFLTWNFLTLYNYFMAAFKGPGFVPADWKPSNKAHLKKLQFCEMCEAYKAPRSHHCRKCDRCVMKMDHHCPWINTCCGHFNHGNFTYFLFFAPLGCIHSLILLIPASYRALNFTWYLHYGDRHNLVYLGIVGFLLAMFAIGLAIGVIIAVGMLLFIQVKSVIKNETGIETWIIEKAEDRDRDEDEPDFDYPYNLGCWGNWTQVFTWTGRPKSDGFTWDVKEGCTQFTFTKEQLRQKALQRERTMEYILVEDYSGAIFPISKEEQLRQKALKRERTMEYILVEDYSGAIFPISKGCGMCCGIPCTDEPRIKVVAGDKVKVTRWKRKWLYGTKILDEKQKAALKPGEKKRTRGWFPRRCAREYVSSVPNGEQQHIPDDATSKKKK